MLGAEAGEYTSSLGAKGHVTVPSHIARMIRERYPRLADRTNLTAQPEVDFVSGIVAALKQLPQEVIPSDIATRFVAAVGSLERAVQSCAVDVRRGHLVGRHLTELLTLLDLCPDEPFRPDDTERIVKLEKPLVFISCGQYAEEEVALGKEIERLVREDGRYDAYFAEQQNSLEGLSSNILSSLGRCSAFVGVMHHRGVVTKLSGEVVRASVWIEQEIAIAAFIQHALERKIEVALYIQRGIVREGIREQLRLAPVEFAAPDDVLNDVRERLTGWNLGTSPPAVEPETAIRSVQHVSGLLDSGQPLVTMTIASVQRGHAEMEWTPRDSVIARFVSDHEVEFERRVTDMEPPGTILIEAEIVEYVTPLEWQQPSNLRVRWR